MATLTALYDACVLYPAPLRDLLMHLALTDLFRAKWSNTIHDEWIRNVLKNRPDLTHAQLERTQALMDIHVRDCLVTDYEDLIPSLTLPDPEDRHVLATAIRGRAEVIVTYNQDDFPSAVLNRYGVYAQHPDTFITHLLDHDEEAVCAAVKRQRLSLRNPTRTVATFLAILKRQALTETVNRLTARPELL